VIVGSANKAAEGLSELEPGKPVIVLAASKMLPPSLVAQVRTGPGNAIEDDQPESPARYIDAVPHRICS